MRVDKLLNDLLEATAAKTAASRRIDRLRDVLDTEARRRLATEGAAPSWKAAKLGSVRLDPKPAKAYVADPDAFASYVAERHPSEVTARIELPAAALEAALEALGFAGVPVHRSAVEVRPTFTEALLANADVLYDDSDPANIVKAVGRVEPTTGALELIAGTDVLPPSASLVVSLDRDRKRAELERVDLELEDELAPVDSTGEPIAPADLEAVAAAEAHAADVGARLIASATATGEAARDADYADSRVVSARQDAAADAADTAHLGDPYVAPEPPPAPPPTEARTEPELAPHPDEVSLGTPDPVAAATVAAAAGAPVEPVPGVVDELVKLSSDDLKRAARAHRVPLNGTKVLLAGRLARAGVTADDVVALRPA